jgi:hypothetical protein
MAYQNIGTPRFFIDWFSYAKAIGIDIPDSQYDYTSPIGINPSNIAVAEYLGTPNTMSLFKFGNNISAIKPKVIPINFIAVLGHNYSGRQLDPHFHNIDDNFNYIDGFHPTFTDICNWGTSSTKLEPTYDGFSIGGISNMFNGTVNNLGVFSLYQGSTYNPNTPYTYKSGSCIVGNYYDMPHSPDLKLTMTREMDGVKRIRTKGGADLVDHRYTKPAMWTDANGVGGAAWELYSGTPTNKELSRSGRRVWDLSFSYLQDSDLFPDVSSLSNYETAGYSYGDSVTDNTLLNEDTFFSQVIHKTQGGKLRFLFQPDKNNNNPDQFAIAKLDMKSFKFSQVANGVYNVKLKIREVW